MEIENFSVRYNRVAALNDVSLQVAAGEVTAVIGSNGAGKTSLVNAAMGLHSYSGCLRFPFAPDAVRSTEARVRARIALVPETRDLFGPMTVRDNLRLGAYVLRHKGQRTTEERISEIFSLFPRLEERQLQLAHTLSGGERQMLALGRALMLRPRLLMLDEPSLGLAPLLVAEIFRVIERLRSEGVSILLIEQNARAALRIADRAYVLENGAVIIEGRAHDVAADPRVIASYLGMSKVAAGREMVSVHRTAALDGAAV